MKKGGAYYIILFAAFFSIFWFFSESQITKELHSKTGGYEDRKAYPTMSSVSRTRVNSKSALLAEEPYPRENLGVSVNGENNNAFYDQSQLVSSGYFSELMEEVFDHDLVGEYLNRIQDLISVKEISTSESVSSAARETVREQWLPMLASLDLDPETAYIAEAILEDHFSRKFELLFMWTNGDISRADFDESEGQIVSIDERLGEFLSNTELDLLSIQRQKDSSSAEFSREFKQISEEMNSGSLYPLVFSDDQTTLSAYLAAGADANARRDGDVGTSLLATAINAGSNDSASLLVAYGADVNFTDSDGHTVLHLAAELGNAELVALLIDAGADPSAKNRVGLTPHMSARIAAVFSDGAGFSEVLELLAK